MSLVISYIDRSIESLNKHIERYERKGLVHPNPIMVTWYEDRAKTTKYEIQELEFIRDLVKHEHETLRISQ